MSESAKFQALQTLTASLQDGTGHADVWGHVESAARTCFGFRYLTILAVDQANGRMMRLHSTAAAADRVGGVKAITDGIWTTSIVREGKILVGSGPDELARIFSNFQRILEIGCGSSLNIPVRDSGRTIGSLNLFDEPGAYDALDRNLAICFAQLLVTPFRDALERLPTHDPDARMEAL